MRTSIPAKGSRAAMSGVSPAGAHWIAKAPPANRATAHRFLVPCRPAEGSTRRFALGQLQHVAERGDVCASTGRALPKTGALHTARHSSNSAQRGNACTAFWLTMAGLGGVTGRAGQRAERLPIDTGKTKEKGSAVARAAFCATAANYFAAVLPKRLRKRSTRPPMLSTDFCVPV